MGPPKTDDGSWWRGLTECGPVEKGMANHFSILALRTPWIVWKGKMKGYWTGNSLCKYLAHRICGILVSRDVWNWTGPGPQKDDCCVGKGMDGMTWKVYSSSNFDDVILTRWGQWRIRRLLMLPLCFSSWVYSSGNCIFSLAWALRLWCTAYASQKPFVSHMKQAAKGSWRNSANQLSASTFSFSSGNPRSFTDYSF